MFLHGCNYPWSTDGTTVFYGLDFGANVWGSHLGVSTRRDAIARDFSGMAALGFTAARWFVFGDGRSGIVYDDRGIPVGPAPHLFDDMDAALEIARDTGIRVDLVLLDHRWMFEGVRETIVDPATGALLEGRLPEGRSGVLHATAGRDALVRRVFEPLVSRYGDAGERRDLGPQILAFELMNEPDFIVEEWERDLSPRAVRPLTFGVLAELVTALSDLVHRRTRAFTTIGCARLHNLWAWDDPALGLDMVQLHSYPDTRHQERDTDVFGMPASTLGVSRPVILGEFPGDGPGHHPIGASPPETTLAEYLEFAVEGGYSGAWPWSFSGTDDYGTLPEAPLHQFAMRHRELVNPRCTALHGPQP
ncbi:MAG TPA: hypothetical protein VI485_32885 [Vicinamibacterales bacterium]|nr:hypothetical protein [Vicinamibacterales bacterium]